MRRACIAFALTALLAASSIGHAQESPAAESAVDRAIRMVDAFESLDSGATADVEIPDPGELGAVYQSMVQHVAANPDDVPALIVLARVGMIKRLGESLEFTAGEPPPSAASSAEPSIRALNRALSLEPDNAEAHYWLARTYGITVPQIVDGTFTAEPLDLGQAIVHARRAVDAAPAELKYREALAIYLVTAERFAEAIDVFDGSPAPDHIIRRILVDLGAVPLPAAARFLPQDSAGLAELMASRGRFADYFELRTRVYVAPGTRAVFEDGLRARWPDFEFYEADREKADGGPEMIVLVQILEERDGALQPMAVKAVEQSSSSSDPVGIVLVNVVEMLGAPPETQDRFGVEAEQFTVLSIAGIRKAERDFVALTELGERLVGEWEIEEWRYRGEQGMESYTGTLTIIEQANATEFRGELFARGEDGNWGRQLMQITVDGDRLELRGSVIASGGPWFPDNLSLTLEGESLAGRSVDASGEGGRVVFRRP